MCRHFMEDYGIQVRIARYHNIYGPYGTYDGGEKKLLLTLQKSFECEKNNNKIEVWGDKCKHEPSYILMIA